MSIEEKFKSIITDKLGLKPEEIVGDEPLCEDSTELVEIVVALKTGFGIEIGNNEIPVESSFNQIIDFLKAKGVSV